ncbi:hypothetical protein [Arthrobacter sp. NPDC093139]|uniref:hypothetical protein n=1 Tax=Arthrobacter sp. NPDC093139 TaxID=3363945 RepID=UPI00381DCD95
MSHAVPAILVIQFHKLISSIIAAAVGKTAELVEILSFCYEFDELAYGVTLAIGGPFPQPGQIRVVIVPAFH